MKKDHQHKERLISFYRRMIPAFYLLILLFSGSCRQGTADEYSVMTGPFRQSIIQTGELESVKASVITMPSLDWQYGYEYKLIGLVEHGKTVQKGDSIIALDPSNIYKIVIRTEETLENEKAAANKQRVQMENNMQDLLAQLKNEQAKYDLKKLELERIKYDSESKKKIKELEFQQATISLGKVKRNLELRPKLDDLDIKIQKIKILQRESEIADARKALNKLTIYSPMDGIFQVSKSWWSGQFVRLGDNIYMGSKIASIPDIKRMKVLSYVNETDLKKLKHGMKVIVKLDALPSVPFNGVISYIGKICTTQDDEKIFKTEVEILESDVRLKPGMTVSCEYVCYETENEMFVPNSCLMKDDGHSYVFPDIGMNPVKVEVISGASNSNYSVISGDVKPGQKLVPVEKTIIKNKI